MINIVDAVVLELPTVPAYVVIHHFERHAGGEGEDVAVIDFEVHEMVVGRAICAPAVAAVAVFVIVAVLAPIDIVFRDRFAAGDLVILLQPEIVIAVLWVPKMILRVCFAQRHPHRRRVADRAAQVLVGKNQCLLVNGIGCRVAGEDQIVSVFVQRVVNRPKGATFVIGHLRIAAVTFEADGHIRLPSVHQFRPTGTAIRSTIIAVEIRDALIRHQAVMFEADAQRAGVIAPRFALVPVLESRRHLQEECCAVKQRRVEIQVFVHRLHPQVGCQAVCR